MHQASLSLHGYIGMQGQQNIKKIFMFNINEHNKVTIKTEWTSSPIIKCEGNIRLWLLNMIK